MINSSKLLLTIVSLLLLLITTVFVVVVEAAFEMRPCNGQSWSAFNGQGYINGVYQCYHPFGSGTPSCGVQGMGQSGGGCSGQCALVKCWPDSSSCGGHNDGSWVPLGSCQSVNGVDFIITFPTTTTTTTVTYTTTTTTTTTTLLPVVSNLTGLELWRSSIQIENDEADNNNITCQIGKTTLQQVNNENILLSMKSSSMTTSKMLSMNTGELIQSTSLFPSFQNFFPNTEFTFTSWISSSFSYEFSIAYWYGDEQDKTTLTIFAVDNSSSHQRIVFNCSIYQASLSDIKNTGTELSEVIPCCGSARVR